MLRHLISTIYFFGHFDQFENILQCDEETTVRRPAAATAYTHTHTHTAVYIDNSRYSDYTR